MTGRLTIDGHDAYARWGVFVERDGLKGLAQMPAFKAASITTNDWHEYDGVEVDLSTPVLDTRQVQVPFCVLNVADAETLLSELADGAYHTFYFAELDKTYTLRLVSNDNFSQLIKLGKLTLTFADDFPEVPTTQPYDEGVSDVRQSGYKLDDIEFSRFGVYVLQGTDTDLRKSPSTKANLTISVANIAGVDYDGEMVVFKTHDTTLKLLINAANVAEFWQRYNSLFAVLMQSDTHKLHFAALNTEYECYYKSCSVSRLRILPKGRVWCEFSVVLVFTSARPADQNMLLVTEDYDYVTTEDGSKIIIRPK